MAVFEKQNSIAKMNTNTTDNDQGTVLSVNNSDVYHGHDETSQTVSEKLLLRKIDRWLLPLLTVSYMLQFLDKQSLNFSSIMGLIQDLNLKGTQYSWSSSVFYFGYLTFSYPASWLMVRLPIGTYLAGTCVVWATCLCLHAVTTNFTSLVIIRFFLGAAEASISPGFSLITGMWYRRSEQPFRHGIWFFGNSIALAFGGLLAYGIAHTDGVLPAWKWLFIIFGLITLAWAVVLILFLPNSPAQARFLTEEERVKAVDRIRSNQTGMKDNHFKWSQVWEAVTDIKVWLIVLYQLSNSIPNGAITTFSSLVISGFGFTRLQVYLLQLPAGAIHGIFALLAPYICSRFKNSRCITAAILCAISLLGSILVRYGPNSGSQLFGLWIFVAYAAGIPISLSLLSSNVAGFTKKSVSTAMLFFAYCIGNIVGPFLFFPSEAPTYQSGFTATIVCFAISICLITALRFIYVFENRKRDRNQTAESAERRKSEYEAQSTALSVADTTDRENYNFRYLF